MSLGKDRPPDSGGRERLSAQIIPFSSPQTEVPAPRAPLQRFELLEQELRGLRRQFARTLEELAAAPPRPWDEEFVRRLAPPVDAAFDRLLRLTGVLTDTPEDGGRSA